MLSEKIKKIKEKARAYNTLNKRVLLIFIISFVWIITYKLYLIDIKEIFPKAHDIAEIVFNLLSSVIASCIFYYFAVYIEQRRVAKILHPNLINRLRVFGTSRYVLLMALCEAKGIAITVPTTSEQVSELFSSINLRSKPPIVHNYHGAPFNNWFELFDYFFNSDKITANQIYTFAANVPASILQLLDELSYSYLELALHQYANEPLAPYSNDLKGVSNLLFHYLDTLRKISELHSTELQ
jgi:hypothetical protein